GWGGRGLCRSGHWSRADSAERRQHSTLLRRWLPGGRRPLATAAGPALAVSVPHTRRFVLGCEESSPSRSRRSIGRCPYTRPPEALGVDFPNLSVFRLC